MIPGIYTDTLTRHRAPAVTGIHGGTRDWDNAATAVITGVRVQPTGAESPGDTEGTLATYRLMGPVDLDLTDKDRLEYDGPAGTEWLEVIGDPQRYRGAYGAVDHSATLLRGIRGR